MAAPGLAAVWLLGPPAVLAVSALAVGAVVAFAACVFVALAGAVSPGLAELEGFAGFAGAATAFLVAHSVDSLHAV